MIVHPTPKPSSGERGNALFVVMVALIVAGALMFSLYYSSRTARLDSSLRTDAERAYAAADFGVSRVFLELERKDSDLRTWAMGESSSDAVRYVEGVSEGIKYRVQVRSAYFSSLLDPDSVEEWLKPMIGRTDSGDIRGIRDVFFITSMAESVSTEAPGGERVKIRPTVETVIQARGSDVSDDFPRNSPYFQPEVNRLHLDGDSFYISGESRWFRDFRGTADIPPESVGPPFPITTLTATYLEPMGDIALQPHNLFARGRISLRVYAGGKEHTLLEPKFSNPDRRIRNNPAYQPGTTEAKNFYAYEDPVGYMRDPKSGAIVFPTVGPFTQDELLTMYMAVEPDKTEYAGLGNYKVNVDKVDQQIVTDKTTGQTSVIERYMSRNYIVAPADVDDPAAQRKVFVVPETSAAVNPTLTAQGFSAYYYKDLTDQWWYQSCPTCHDRNGGKCTFCNGKGTTSTTLQLSSGPQTLTYPCTQCMDWVPCSTCGDTQIENTACTLCNDQGRITNCPECQARGWNACYFSSVAGVAADKNYGVKIDTAKALSMMAEGKQPEHYWSTNTNGHKCDNASNNVSLFGPSTPAEVKAYLRYLDDLAVMEATNTYLHPENDALATAKVGKWSDLKGRGIVACPFCVHGAPRTTGYYNTQTGAISSTAQTSAQAIKDGWIAFKSYGIKGWTYPYFCPRCSGATANSGSHVVGGANIPITTCTTCKGQTPYHLPCQTCHNCSSCKNDRFGKHANCDNGKCTTCMWKGWSTRPTKCKTCNGAATIPCPNKCPFKGWMNDGICTECKGTGYNSLDIQYETVTCPICVNAGKTSDGCLNCHETGKITITIKNCKPCHGTGEVPMIPCGHCTNGSITCTGAGCVNGYTGGVTCNQCDPLNLGWMPQLTDCEDCEGRGSHGGGICLLCKGTRINPNTQRCVCYSWSAAVGGRNVFRICPNCKGRGGFACEPCKGTGKVDLPCGNCEMTKIVKTNCKKCVNRVGTGKCATCDGVGAREQDKITPRDFRLTEDLKPYIFDSGIEKNGQMLKSVSMMICFEDLPSIAVTATEKGIADFDYNDVRVIVDLREDNEQGSGGGNTSQGVLNRWWRQNDLQALTGEQSVFAVTSNPRRTVNGTDRGTTTRDEDYGLANWNQRDVYGKDAQGNSTNDLLFDFQGKITTFSRRVGEAILPGEFDRSAYAYFPGGNPTPAEIAESGRQDIRNRFVLENAIRATGFNAFNHTSEEGLDVRAYAAALTGGGPINIDAAFYDEKGEPIIRRDDRGNILSTADNPLGIAMDSATVRLLGGESIYPDGSNSMDIDSRVDAYYESTQAIYEATARNLDSQGRARSVLGEYHGAGAPYDDPENEGMVYEDNIFKNIVIGKPGTHSYAMDPDGRFYAEPVLDANGNRVPFNAKLDNIPGLIQGPDGGPDNDPPGSLFRIRSKIFDPNGDNVLTGQPDDPAAPREILKNDLPTFVFDQPLEGAGTLVINGNAVFGSEFNYAGTIVVMGDCSVDPRVKDDGSLDNSARLMVQGNLVVLGKSSGTSFFKLYWSPDVIREADKNNQEPQLVLRQIGYNKHDNASDSDWSSTAP